MANIQDGYGRRLPIGIEDDRRIIPAGDFNQPISFLRSTRVPDSGTGFDEQYTQFYHSWAAFISADEDVTGEGEAEGSQAFQFVIRTDPDQEIGSESFIYYQGSLYGIIKARLRGKRSEYMYITAYERGPINAADITSGETTIETSTDTGTETDAPDKSAEFWPDDGYNVVGGE